MNIERLNNIEALIKERAEINAKLSLLSEPTLHDIERIDEFYLNYRKLFARRGIPHQSEWVYSRKKFLFVIIYLYSPSALVGHKLRRGLRDKLARLFGLNAPSTISDNVVNLMSDYVNYRDFRRDVHILYEEFLPLI